MRKDIEIPKVENIHVAAVNAFNKEHLTYDWNVYLINDSNEPLELVLIVSKGYNAKKNTSQLRHKLDVLPAKSYAKVEFIEYSVLKLNNIFQITYFLKGKLHEKDFVFKAGSINEDHAVNLPVMTSPGILAE